MSDVVYHYLSSSVLKVLITNISNFFFTSNGEYGIAKLSLSCIPVANKTIAKVKSIKNLKNEEIL